MILSGLDILRSVISMSAMHDSREQFPAPKCFPNTYIDIKETIVEWSTKANQPAILCFTGEPKSGKSAIAHEIADILSSRGTLAGSFFFERDKSQDDGDFFLTLAYQIAVNIPGMDKLVNKAMLRDPTIISKRGGTQLTKLILEPLFCLPSLETPFIVVVDEINLCSQQVSRLQIISLLSRASLMFSNTLRFLIFTLRGTLDDVIDGNNFYWVGRHIELDGKAPPTSPLCVSRLSDQFFDPCPSSVDSIVRTLCSVIEVTGPSNTLEQQQRRHSYHSIDRDTSASIAATSWRNPARSSEIVPTDLHSSGSPMSVELLRRSSHEIIAGSPMVIDSLISTPKFGGSPMVIDSLRFSPRYGGSPMVIDDAYLPQQYGVNTRLASFSAHQTLSINQTKVSATAAEELRKRFEF